MKKDLNKGIDSIKYNYLKLVNRIKFSNGTWVNYQYDANGKKIKKVTSQGITTDYIANKIYENGNLYQTSHDEGRIVNGIYEYNITDHLGNLRVSLKDSAGIAVPLQSLFYDPWGLSMKGMAITRNPTNFNKFQFLNRETQFETGYIDLIHRQFDPSIARFTSQDPVIEGQEHLSLYQYSWNNPILKSDPDGEYPGEGLWNKFKNWLNGTPSESNKIIGQIYSNTAYNGHTRNPQTNQQIVVDAIASSIQVIGQEQRGGLGMTRAALTQTPRRTVPSARAAAVAHAENLRNNSTKPLPTVTGAAVDVSTGKVVVQVSGKPNPTALNPVLQSTAPNPSLEPWSICNCGETKAVNVLVNEGSSIFNIKYHAVRTKTGESMAPCRNCQETLQNATHEKHD